MKPSRVSPETRRRAREEARKLASSFIRRSVDEGGPIAVGEDADEAIFASLVEDELDQLAARLEKGGAA